MEKFQLSLLFKIIGIGSASGLIHYNNSLYLISDNSTYLYQYELDSLQLSKRALYQFPQENIPKKIKPDFEAIALMGSMAYILGSGSTENRNKFIKCHLKSNVQDTVDLTPAYDKIKKELQISDEDLNIEGFCFGMENVYFFQRGNGANSKNGIVTMRDLDMEYDPRVTFFPFSLPKINNVEATFTDAILLENTFYFLAAAEDTNSTYEDGQVLGSIFGSIDLKTMKINFAEKISDTNKFEGITLFKKSATEIEFLLCEDNDTDILESNIYSLKLDLKK